MYKICPFAVIAIITFISVFSSCGPPNPIPPRVLVFSKTKGWKHTCIPFGMSAITKLGRENGFEVDTTKDASLFTEQNLKKYRCVIFNGTTGNVLNAEQQGAFERYIQAGGGFVGIHSAADTEYEWAWYDKLVGAHFASHPHNPNVRKASIDVTDRSQLSTKGLPARWERTDEWYNYKTFYSGINVLASLDENTYEGGTNGANHPIAWYHDFDGGRAFYTGCGHTDSSYIEPLFLSHLLGGINYAMGNGMMDLRKSYSIAEPEENRFAKTTLVTGLRSPMELAVADDGRIFFTKLRTANLTMYDTKTGRSSLVHQFNVATKGGTGLIGVTLDPRFSSNSFIYLYYSPPKETEPIIFNLSRFKVNQNNTLDLSSEKILLQVPVQLNSGAHHGGSLSWDKDGNLYLSTGDSTTPFPSNGYAPLDERPEPEFYSQDAQRSAANTNDLKGKVLRIHPEDNGTYTIPKGNLFPERSKLTRPEIYVMGCRNPYRIAVNPKTSVLYWGEIGPDAGKDSVQGPRGYDEFNQAKRAGNFGWPYFVGNNQAYAKWNFATQKAGARFDSAAPLNTSPNSTGLKKLPPAIPPMIWYPYAASQEFPELGKGGRSAMAGAFYSYDRHAGPGKFPAYYDGSLFVFDWMRNWVIALRFDQNEKYKRSEPFMTANGDFRRPIDLAFGKDGKMYMLEYGSVYGADNADARLVRIEYNDGNRPPVAKAGIIDSATTALKDKTVFLTSERAVPALRQAAGEAPLRVLFTTKGTRDLDDDDKIRIEWLFDGVRVGSKESNPVYSYRKPGVYHAVLRVTDQSGAVGTDTLVIKVGDEPPDVSITSRQNRSFYFKDQTFGYDVKVTDQEDKKIDRNKINVLLSYQPHDYLEMDGEQKEAQPIGLTLLQGGDCKACHTTDKVSVGPSYKNVSARYKAQSGAVSTLAKKIIAGGGGSWGTEHVMSAHPQIPFADAAEIVKYILAISDVPDAPESIAPSGTLTFKNHKSDEIAGKYKISAQYTDEGANGIGPLTTKDIIYLRDAKTNPVYADAHTGFPRWGKRLSQGSHKSFVLLKTIDMTGIKKFDFEYAAKDKNGAIEVRMDSEAGPVVCRAAFSSTGEWSKTSHVTASLPAPVSGRHDIYFVVVKPDKPNNDLINLTSIEFLN